MTVQELINLLLTVEDKNKNVELCDSHQLHTLELKDGEFDSNVVVIQPDSW
jgi:hypothetical protein